LRSAEFLKFSARNQSVCLRVQLPLFFSFYTRYQKHRTSSNQTKALPVRLSTYAIHLWVNYLYTKYFTNNLETLQLETRRSNLVLQK